LMTCGDCAVTSRPSVTLISVSLPAPVHAIAPHLQLTSGTPPPRLSMAHDVLRATVAVRTVGAELDPDAFSDNEPFMVTMRCYATGEEPRQRTAHPIQRQKDGHVWRLPSHEHAAYTTSYELNSSGMYNKIPVAALQADESTDSSVLLDRTDRLPLQERSV
jgi:hypothetical protein